MAYRKLYQREINADVPARIQILESGSEEYEGHVPKIQNYSDWSKNNEYTHGRTVYQLCEGCRKSLTSYESEAHSPADNPILAVEKDNNTHLLTFSCFRSTCDYQYENIEEQHTYLKNKTYVEPRDNQYHIGGYLCDRSDIGCTNKSSSPVKIEHTYWSNYGGAFDVVGDGLFGGDYYCQDCGHLLDRQRMTISATGESFLSDDGYCYRRIDFYLNGQPVSRIYATVEGITPNGLDSEDISASTTQDQTMVSVTLSKEYKVDDGVKIDVNIYSGDLNQYCNSTQTIWL